MQLDPNSSLRDHLQQVEATGKIGDDCMCVCVWGGLPGPCIPHFVFGADFLSRHKTEKKRCRKRFKTRTPMLNVALMTDAEKFDETHADATEKEDNLRAAKTLQEQKQILIWQ